MAIRNKPGTDPVKDNIMKEKQMKRPCEKCGSVNTTVVPRRKGTIHLRCANCGHEELIPKEDDGSDYRFSRIEKAIILQIEAEEDALIRRLENGPKKADK